MLILVWIDDFTLYGPDHLIQPIKKELRKVFKTEDVGEMNEYAGCKIEHNCNKRTMKLMQPVKIQKFEDKFNIPKDPHQPPTTQAEPGTIL